MQLVYPMVSRYSTIWFLRDKRDLHAVTLLCGISQGRVSHGLFGIREMYRMVWDGMVYIECDNILFCVLK